MRYRVLLFALGVLLASTIALHSAELSEEERATAEARKNETIAALEDEVEKKDQLVRQARAQKSRQLRSLVKDLEEARKKAGAARRKTLEEYFADSKSPPAATEKRSREGVPLGIAGDKGLSVIFPYTVAYVPQGAEGFEYSFLLAAFDGKKPTEGFFDVGGTPVRLKAESSDATIVEIKPDPKFTLSPFIVCFHRPGTVTITVQAGAYKVEQTVKVVQIPVNAEAPSSDVIEEMGFPKEKKRSTCLGRKTSSLIVLCIAQRLANPSSGSTGHTTITRH